MGCLSSQEGKLKDLFLENKFVELQNALNCHDFPLRRPICRSWFVFNAQFLRILSEYKYGVWETNLHVFFYSLFSFIVCMSLGIRSFVVPRIFPYLVKSSIKQSLPAGGSLFRSVLIWKMIQLESSAKVSGWFVSISCWTFPTNGPSYFFLVSGTTSGGAMSIGASTGDVAGGTWQVPVNWKSHTLHVWYIYLHEW